jgi:hypothetical protein
MLSAPHPRPKRRLPSPITPPRRSARLHARTPPPLTSATFDPPCVHSVPVDYFSQYQRSPTSSDASIGAPRSQERVNSNRASAINPILQNTNLLFPKSLKTSLKNITKDHSSTLLVVEHSARSSTAPLSMSKDSYTDISHTRALDTYFGKGDTPFPSFVHRSPCIAQKSVGPTSPIDVQQGRHHIIISAQMTFPSTFRSTKKSTKILTVLIPPFRLQRFLGLTFIAKSL